MRLTAKLVVQLVQSDGRGALLAVGRRLAVLASVTVVVLRMLHVLLYQLLDLRTHVFILLLQKLELILEVCW